MLQAFPSFPTLLRPRTGMVRMAATELAARSVQIYRQPAASLSSARASKPMSSSRDLCIFRRPSAPRSQSSAGKSVTGSDSIIWDAGLWSEDSMRNALTQGFSSTLLIECRQRYGDVLGRTVRDGIPFGTWWRCISDWPRPPPSQPNVRTLPAARMNLFRSMHLCTSPVADPATAPRSVVNCHPLWHAERNRRASEYVRAGRQSSAL
jgi:hypothetical protein